MPNKKKDCYLYIFKIEYLENRAFTIITRRIRLYAFQKNNRLDRRIIFYQINASNFLQKLYKVQ